MVQELDNTSLLDSDDDVVRVDREDEVDGQTQVQEHGHSLEKHSIHVSKIRSSVFFQSITFITEMYPGLATLTMKIRNAPVV